MASDEENVRENPISIEALLHKLNRKTATLISAFIPSLLEETMITLYEMYPTRSQRAKWALEEIGVQYNSKTVDMRAGAHRQTEYTAINPMQVMPTLESPDYRIHESVAIVFQLADQYPDAGLAPSVGSPERARYYQWAIFGCAELDFPLGLVTQNELLLPEDKRSAPMAKLGRELFSKRAQVLSDSLGDDKYILGDQFSGADIVLGYNCFWSSFTGMLDEHSVLKDYLGRLQAREAFHRAFEQPS